jgi:hypothetical protein
MRKIIPREQIKHLEWKPGDAVPEPSKPPQQEEGTHFTPENILNGQSVYNEIMPRALKEAIEYSGTKGIVASMPELIAAKAIADKDHDFWKNWYTIQTEENIGLDSEGRFGTRGEPVLVTVHGGGLLTPDRIDKAYEEGLVAGSARYIEEEFDRLLEGKLPDDTEIHLYRLEEIESGRDLPRRFGIVTPYELIQNTASGQHRKEAFIQHPLVLSRLAGLEKEIITDYFEKAKFNDKVGIWHPFKGRNAAQASGRLLYVDNTDYGLNGNSDLDDSGRFVGIAPEAPDARGTGDK